ncbi:hypothetical protein PG996_008166 [Apiospora saccharicola]|uniref:Uncharacterized protein n=1 Tax=Apiospora saccharicola TaxID=335842 RepID=A0ABR1V099_9PEZI
MGKIEWRDATGGPRWLRQCNARAAQNIYGHHLSQGLLGGLRALVSEVEHARQVSPRRETNEKRKSRRKKAQSQAELMKLLTMAK